MRHDDIEMKCGTTSKCTRLRLCMLVLDNRARGHARKNSLACDLTTTHMHAQTHCLATIFEFNTNCMASPTQCTAAQFESKHNASMAAQSTRTLHGNSIPIQNTLHGSLKHTAWQLETKRMAPQFELRTHCVAAQTHRMATQFERISKHNAWQPKSN